MSAFGVIATVREEWLTAKRAHGKHRETIEEARHCILYSQDRQLIGKWRSIGAACLRDGLIRRRVRRIAALLPYGRGRCRMPNHQFLPFVDSETNLDLATAAILDAAYDRALAELHDRSPDSVRKAIARRIATLAVAGERDPDRLCDKALIAVGFLPQ